MDFRFFVIYGLLSLLLFLIVFVMKSFKHKKFVFPRYSFTPKKYYLMLLPAPLAALIYSLLLKTFLPFVLFCVFCIMGVIGEIIFSLWWKQYYKERFWVYTTKTLINKYTSSLNFLAWGVGGFLYMAILDVFSLAGFVQLPFLFFVIFLILALIQLLIFFLVLKFSKIKKFNKVTFQNWLLFTLPILITLILLIIRFGLIILFVFIAFGLVAAIIEYLFGKLSKLFLSRKLWTYTYLQKDNGHFTILSIPAFAFGGFYFWLIYALFMFIF